jgi:hypothetical protein
MGGSYDGGRVACREACERGAVTAQAACTDMPVSLLSYLIFISYLIYLSIYLSIYLILSVT